MAMSCHGNEPGTVRGEKKRQEVILPFYGSGCYFLSSAFFLSSPFFISFLPASVGSPFLPSDFFASSPFFISFLGASSFLSCAKATGVTATAAKTAATSTDNSLLMRFPLGELNIFVQRPDLR